MRVMSPSGNVEHQFQCEPRRAAEWMLFSILHDLRLVPRHVTPALDLTQRLYARARINRTLALSHGKRDQTAQRLQPVPLRVRRSALQHGPDVLGLDRGETVNTIAATTRCLELAEVIEDRTAHRLCRHGQALLKN